MSRAYAPSLLATSTAVLGVYGIASIWLGFVNDLVPEPYLDEYFHVRQAQKYCAGKFSEWDPKITTPPGLYLISTAIQQITSSCNIGTLRTLNALLLALMIPLITGMARSSDHVPESTVKTKSTWSTLSPSYLNQVHTAFNVCLFPPLFFFAGLYYTDVASTASVLLFMLHFTTIHHHGRPNVAQDLVTVLLGIITLFFRQTNVFWVSIFPAGIVLVSSIDELHDPLVAEARLEDYLFCVTSLITKLDANLRSRKGFRLLLQLIRLIVPYATILACFAAFIAWNGGVVLGDKSNHVATLHLPQMLYIWPYITFFSIPLTYPCLVQGALGIIGNLPLLGRLVPGALRHKQTPGLLVLLDFVAVAAVVVKFNTIVHPFTLADNRHYTFYVFRLLLRHPATKFLAAPVYVLGAWSALQSIGAPPVLSFLEHDKSQPSTNKVLTTTDKNVASQGLSLKINNAAAGEGATVAFVLVWLATSALQLITAPLVEPRYFILPWIMWRLRVPVACKTQAGTSHPSGDSTSSRGGQSSWILRTFWSEHDHRLWLETAWFLVVNAGTAWMFLYRGFEWKQEPGAVQRFMW